MFAAGRRIPTVVAMRSWPRPPVLGAGLAFAALALLGVAVHVSTRAQRLDADLLEAVARAGVRLRLEDVIDVVLHAGDPLPYLGMSALVVAYAAWRRGPRLALALAAVLLLAPLSAELLKLATAEPRAHDVAFAAPIADASWPSGHTTAAVALAFCALAAAPSRWRPVVAAAGFAYAMAMGFSVVARVSHFPSDALAAWLLSAGWFLLALGAARLPQRL